MSRSSKDTGVRPYLDSFARFAKELPGNGAGWVDPLRREAIARFEALGFPSTHDEAWRYTSMRPIAEGRFELHAATRGDVLTPEQFERLTFEPWECSHLVFVNGRYAPGLSTLRSLPAGLRVTSLAEALATRRGSIEPHLGSGADASANAFVALNTAFLHDGAFVEVDPGTIVEEPIHLLFVSTPNGFDGMSHPRNLFVVGAGARITLAESYAGIDAERYLTNAVTEIVAGDGSVIDHYKLQRESRTAFHVATLHAAAGRNATISSHSITLGGALTRNDVIVAMRGEGADCTLNGLYVADGRQHMDNHTLIDHEKPHGSSRQLYKGVLDDQARGVFDGTVIVRPDAQKTDARQENRNLLMSEDALVDSKPTLLIHADDVKCSHAATIGQLDEDALFYLRARGIGAEAARSLLTQGFVSEILQRVRVEAVRAGLECLLFMQLPHHPHAAVRRP